MHVEVTEVGAFDAENVAEAVGVYLENCSVVVWKKFVVFEQSSSVQFQL